MSALLNDYRSHPGVNWSTLKYLRESPLKYKHNLTQPEPDSTAKALGRATHCLVFEPQLFEQEFAIFTEGDRRGKVWTEFKDAHAGQTILKANEVEDVMGMANAVRVHPLVSPYLLGGVFERAVYWTDPDTGLPCKAKMDWTVDGARVLADLKTANTIDALRFGRIAARYGYHGQSGHYANGCLHGLKWEPEKVLLIVVESQAPYDVAVFALDEETLYLGREEVKALMGQLKQLREADVWPGRYTTEQVLQLPPWVYGEDEEDADGLGLKIGGE